jgi:uncharacterized membrane protein
LKARWEHRLDQWTGAGLIDAAAAGRIRDFEAKREKDRGLGWPVMPAIGLGGLLLGAGVLLFVAAHWDKLAPGERFGLVLLLVGLFHVGGALAAGRFAVLSTTLHAVGTICLGAGIFLSGQIFNLQAHWPGGVMLWALGAWAAWALLRDWPQAALVAVLTPVWLLCEWIEATYRWQGFERILTEGVLLLSITYLTAVLPGKETPARKALAWLGGLALIPAALAVILIPAFSSRTPLPLPWKYQVLGWTAAMALPLALAWCLRGKAFWMNLIAGPWVLMLGAVGYLGSHVICALGSIGSIAWGIREARKALINLGIAGFALTVFSFYFSTLFDKLGRAASLAGMGILFLVGGWLLEKMRRKLMAHLEEKGEA